MILILLQMQVKNEISSLCILKHVLVITAFGFSDVTTQFSSMKE